MAAWAALLLGVLLATHRPGGAGEARELPVPPFHLQGCWEAGEGFWRGVVLFFQGLKCF